MNDVIQDMVNNLAGRNDLADAVMKAVAQDLIFIVIPIALVLWFLPLKRERALNERLVFLACVGALSALGAGVALGHFYYQSRPFISDPSTRLLISHSADNGLPSDHALVVFTFAGAVVFRRRALGLALFVAGAAIGFARVYVGIHWPTDILAGAAIGLSVGAVVGSADTLLRPAQAFCSRYLPSVLVAAPD